MVATETDAVRQPPRKDPPTAVSTGTPEPELFGPQLRVLIETIYRVRG